MPDEKHFEAFRTYLQNIGKGSSTKKHYSATVKQLYDLIPKTPQRLTSNDIESFIGWCRNKYSIENNKNPNTLAVKFSAIKRYLKYIKRKGINTISIDEEVFKRPDWIDKPKEILTDEELQRILKASRKSARDYALIYTLIDTAGRVSEIIGINLENINLDNHTILMYDRKVKQYIERTVSDECIKAIITYLEMYREETTERALFTNYKGGRITTQTAWSVVKISAVKAKITKNVTPHTFRHTSITRMLRNGMTDEQVRAHTGHKTTKAFEVYDHLTSGDIRTKVLDSLTFSKPKTRDLPKSNPQSTSTSTSTQETPVEIQIKELELKLLKLKQEQNRKDSMYQ